MRIIYLLVGNLMIFLYERFPESISFTHRYIFEPLYVHIDVDGSDFTITVRINNVFQRYPSELLYTYAIDMRRRDTIVYFFPDWLQERSFYDILHEIFPFIVSFFPDHGIDLEQMEMNLLMRDETYAPMSDAEYWDAVWAYAYSGNHY